MAKDETLSADTSPGSPLSQSTLKVSKEKTFRLVVSTPKALFNTLKYLSTKFYARGEKLDYDEEILFDLCLQRLTDLGIHPKHHLWNRRTMFFNQVGRLWRTFRSGEYPNWAVAQLAILRKSKFLFTPRAFLGIKKTFSVKQFIKLDNRAIRSRPKPQKFIGVGYRDHGTASNESTDASPPWQIVASQNSGVNSLREFNQWLSNRYTLACNPYVFR